MAVILSDGHCELTMREECGQKERSLPYRKKRHILGIENSIINATGA